MLTPWQKSWVIAGAVTAFIHSIRDGLQFAQISTPLSDSFVVHKTTTNPLWSPWNTVILEVALLVMLGIIWRRQQFGVLGWMTVVLALAIGFALPWYWLVVQ